MKLVPMTSAELAAFRDHTVQGFAAEKVKSEGVAEEQALEAAQAAWERAAPEDDAAHVLGNLIVDDEHVGIMWYVVRPEWGQPCVWLYDIEIAAEHRGRGLGREAMAFLEAAAADLGVSTIGLHVFGHNSAARNLYESLGFRPTSIVMRKDLGEAR